MSIETKNCSTATDKNGITAGAEIVDTVMGTTSGAHDASLGTATEFTAGGKTFTLNTNVSGYALTFASETSLTASDYKLAAASETVNLKIAVTGADEGADC